MLPMCDRTWSHEASTQADSRVTPSRARRFSPTFAFGLALASGLTVFRGASRDAFTSARAAEASAPGEPDVEVSVGAGAEQCPGAAELRRRASRIASIEQPTHRYRVAFEYAGGAYRAEVVDATSSRVRRLIDRGPACMPLGQAVAVVLATMWASEQTEPATVAAPASPRPASPPPEAAPREERLAIRDVSALEGDLAAPAPARPWRWSFGAGGGVAAGLVRPVAPAIVADAALEHGPWSLALGALWIPAERLAVGPGFVEVQLLAASARACGFLGRNVHFGACGRILAGGLFADASGYSVATAQTRACGSRRRSSSFSTGPSRSPGQSTLATASQSTGSSLSTLKSSPSPAQAPRTKPRRSAGSSPSRSRSERAERPAPGRHADRLALKRVMSAADRVYALFLRPAPFVRH